MHATVQKYNEEFLAEEQNYAIPRREDSMAVTVGTPPRYDNEYQHELSPFELTDDEDDELLLLDDEEDENVADAIADKERAFRRAWSIFFSFSFLG